MKLYKIEASNWSAFFGKNIEERIERNVTMIAQTPNYDAFLLLSKDSQDGLELLDSVPEGFQFTYCQEWGLTVDNAVIDKIILDLRKKAYGPWEDQLDYIYHNSIADWKTNVISPIKEKYPKR